MALTAADAIYIIESHATEEDYIEAFQVLISTGMAWRLQGWYGRRAMELIEAGLCVAPDWATEQEKVS